MSKERQIYNYINKMEKKKYLEKNNILGNLIDILFVLEYKYQSVIFMQGGLHEAAVTI